MPSTNSFKSEWILFLLSREFAYSLMSLSEKTERSNYLQMLEQKQHLLLNYFKTLSVGLGWVVQKLVNFNPGLSENSRSNFFFKKSWTILLDTVWIFKE